MLLRGAEPGAALLGSTDCFELDDCWPSRRGLEGAADPCRPSMERAVGFVDAADGLAASVDACNPSDRSFDLASDDAAASRSARSSPTVGAQKVARKTNVTTTIAAAASS